MSNGSRPAPKSIPADGGPVWMRTAGAWLGIGTSPGVLLLGAGIAARYDGPVPLLSILLSVVLMFAIMWFQGQLGLQPPFGEGGNLTEIASRYFGPLMQRLLGAVIAIGMTGWFGFNVGLGAAALSALVGFPHWVASLAIGLPILLLSLKGLRVWNWLAAVTTTCVLLLVLVVGLRLSARAVPFTLETGSPANTMTDLAVFVGYVSVFSLRTPDFTSQLSRRRDLLISILLLIVPLVGVALAGVGLEQGTGSADLVTVLAGPGGLAAGNLLITLSVIAPTFTTFYSGAPGIRAATGMDERNAMIVIGVAGLLLALTRFDLWLMSWLSLLAAMLPPFLVPLVIEFIRRRQGHSARILPVWVWLPGSFVAVLLTVLQSALAPLAGLALAAFATALWYRISGDV